MLPSSSMFLLAGALLAGVHQSCALVVQRTSFSSVAARDQEIGATLQAISNTTASDTVDAVDLRYATNITVNGHNFRVLIDTGSIDLWLVTPLDFVFNDTKIPVNNGFLGGAVNGTVGFASVQLGAYTVAQQAFNNAKTVELADILNLGLDGLIGLSFEGLGTPSDIQEALSEGGMDPTLGTPFLLNVFNQSTTDNQNNFMGISLSRTDDLEGTADASFTINEVDPTFANARAPAVPLFPGNNGIWSFLVDGFSVNGEQVDVPPSTVPGAPAGKMVFRLDTGTPTGLLPQPLLDSIYSKIPGSDLRQVAGIEGGSVWTIPCDTTAILSLQIQGQQFPIHPLDLSDVFIETSTNKAVCITPFDPEPGNEFRDILAGDSFMRNFYSIFNFGDTVLGASNLPSVGQNASIQLFSETNTTSAAQDAASVRKTLLATVKKSSAQAGRVASAEVSVLTGVAVLLGLFLIRHI